MAKKILLTLFFSVILVLQIHNAGQYPYYVGYDAKLHLTYANIVSREWRIPTFTESRENYNPPLFYLISGTVGQFFGYKTWQYISLVLAMISLRLWYLVFAKINPHHKNIALLSVALVLTWPVFYKTIVMFSLETFFMFTIACGFWYFICHFYPKPNWHNTLVLAIITSVGMLTRMPAMILAFVFALAMIWQRRFKFLAIFLVVIFSATGWFYLGRDSKEVYGVGEGGETTIPFFKRQPLSFYTDIPFRLMLTYPMRQNLALNKLIPIYYSEFWGDFWNYYPQPRFGLPLTQVRKNREISNSQRIKSLVLQNQVNLVQTVIMILGFIYLLLQSLKPKLKLNEALLSVFALLTWLGFLALLTKFPSWKGDSIKASYMLYVLPIFAYATSLFLLKVISKYRLLYLPLMVYLLLAAIINLSWSWF